MMNELCFDIFELGNHEFDDGDQGAADLIGYLGDSETCETQVLAANVGPALGTPLNPAGTPLFKPFTVKQYGDDMVGFVGLDIAGKTKVPWDTSTVATNSFIAAGRDGYDKFDAELHPARGLGEQT